MQRSLTPRPCNACCPQVIVAPRPRRPPPTRMLGRQPHPRRPPRQRTSTGRPPAVLRREGGKRRHGWRLQQEPPRLLLARCWSKSRTRRGGYTDPLARLKSSERGWALSVPAAEAVAAAPPAVLLVNSAREGSRRDYSVSIRVVSFTCCVFDIPTLCTCV